MLLAAVEQSQLSIGLAHGRSSGGDGSLPGREGPCCLGRRQAVMLVNTRRLTGFRRRSPLWFGYVVMANSSETSCSACEARDNIIVHIAANFIEKVPRHAILVAMLLDRVDLGVKILKIIP